MSVPHFLYEIKCFSQFNYPHVPLTEPLESKILEEQQCFIQRVMASNFALNREHIESHHYFSLLGSSVEHMIESYETNDAYDLANALHFENHSAKVKSLFFNSMTVIIFYIFYYAQLGLAVATPTNYGNHPHAWKINLFVPSIIRTKSEGKETYSLGNSITVFINYKNDLHIIGEFDKNDKYQQWNLTPKNIEFLNEYITKRNYISLLTKIGEHRYKGSPLSLKFKNGDRKSYSLNEISENYDDYGWLFINEGVELFPPYEKGNADNRNGVEEKVPEEKVPEEKVPEEKVPEEKVPEEKVPEENVDILNSIRRIDDFSYNEMDLTKELSIQNYLRDMNSIHIAQFDIIQRTFTDVYKILCENNARLFIPSDYMRLSYLLSKLHDVDTLMEKGLAQDFLKFIRKIIENSIMTISSKYILVNG